MGYERDSEGRLVPVQDDIYCERCDRPRHSVLTRVVLFLARTLCSECFQRLKHGGPPWHIR